MDARKIFWIEGFVHVSVIGLTRCFSGSGALTRKHRVAIGAEWQALVAYVNIACYYLFGIPLDLILGYAVDLGVNGIWYGIVSGTVLQTVILFVIVHRTNWRIRNFREMECKLKSPFRLILSITFHLILIHPIGSHF